MSDFLTKNEIHDQMMYAKDSAKVIELTYALQRHEKLRKLIMELEPFSDLFGLDPNYMSCNLCNPVKLGYQHTANCPVVKLRETLVELGESDE